MYLVQTVAPTQEPISLQEAKDFMRILESDDDATIEAMIKSATSYAENFTNRQFETATFELFAENFTQDIQLPKNPIKDLVSIEYMDQDGVYQVLDSANYYLYGEYDIFKVHFVKTVSHKTHKNAIKYNFISGYDNVPEGIKSFILVMVSTLYENRELYVIGASIETEANPIAMRMLKMYRVQTI